MKDIFLKANITKLALIIELQPDLQSDLIELRISFDSYVSGIRVGLDITNSPFQILYVN